MRPYKIYLSLLLLGVITLLTSLVFPEEGIQVGKTLNLKFHWNPYKTDSLPQYADLTEIFAASESIIADTTDNFDMVDSLPQISQKDTTIKANTKQLRVNLQAIEYPSNDSSTLTHFFNKLDASSRKRVRILHYGDSQIEGDRITAYLRNKFQKQFGGSGPGLLTTLPGRAESSSIIHNASSNWKKHAVYFKADTIIPHQSFGTTSSYARFTSYKNDSSPKPVYTKAYLEFNESNMAFRSVKKIEECRIFYGKVKTPCFIKGYVNDSLIWFNELDATDHTSVVNWEFSQAPKRFKIEFEANTSPDVYGIALDSKKGVVVDNLPLRGSSGTKFNRLNPVQLKQMNAHLNTGLIILQFGVNIVPYETSNYNFYKRAISRQLKYLKNTFPNTSILVIGVSDMSKKQGLGYITYPNLTKVKEAQKMAAFENQCAFWDMYEAMGGKNSMPGWVFAQPPLAQKDFIHFNRKGGHIIAQMLFNALMFEYDSYQLHQKESLQAEI